MTNESNANDPTLVSPGQQRRQPRPTIHLEPEPDTTSETAPSDSSTNQAAPSAPARPARPAAAPKTLQQQNVSPALPPIVRLIITSKGPHYGDMYRIETQSTLIGRDPECDVQIEDRTASRQHAKIRCEGEPPNEHHVLHDLATDNGTFVNGRKLSNPTTLSDGDVIQVGYTELTFKKL